jgi:hypothetical protein
MRYLGVLFVAATAALSAVSPAFGDGLPIGNLDAGPRGVEATSGSTRYASLPAGRGTLVVRVGRHDGLVERSRFLQGAFVVPVVALDGSASGLSTDESTLVLIRPRLAFPRPRTSLVIIDARRLRVRERVTLRGDFSFDALSPDGTSAYLVQYVSSDDPTRYVVRRYDIPAGRLVPGAVVDPHERTLTMRGLPITRASGADGAWAYTLYDGLGTEPFVHALDTVGRKAVCIDLTGLSGRADLYDFRLTLSRDGKTLAVNDSRGPVSLIDTRTFEVSRPSAAPATSLVRPEPPRRPPAGEGASWVVPIGGAIAAIAAVAFLVAFTVRRRRRVVTGSA